MARTYAEECSYLEPASNCSVRIKKGFVPNMKVSLEVSHVCVLALLALSVCGVLIGGRTVLCK